MKNYFISPMLLFVAQPYIAQTQVRPVRIEEKTVITNTYSSKRSHQKQVNHYTYIVYADGTRADATSQNLKPIAFQTTLGAYKWQKWQQSTRRQWTGLPLIATGLLGVAIATKPATRTQGVLIGSIGLASGIWTISHFESQKRKYHRRLIDFCNEQPHSHNTFDTPQSTSEVLKIGFQGTQNGIGLGVNWTF